MFEGLPKNHFGAILADPPWGFKTWSGPEKKVASRGTVAPYQTMEMEYKTCAFSWLKADPYRLFADEPAVYMGLGYWTRANTEACLLGTRGKKKRRDNSVRQGIIAPKRQHSRKPDEIHSRIERLVSGPYLELFARQQRPGWTVWGNETDKFSGVA
jgi:N6-adenosine-specific RNA methylase IME4